MAIETKKQWTYEMGFDDAQVILGDGKINVDGLMVSGSRAFVRDPRLSRLSDERYRPTGKPGASRPERTHVLHMPGMKWCSECDEWKDLQHFSRDGRYRDQKMPHCKECRARHERRMYSLMREAQGSSIRPYTRKEQERVILEKTEQV